MSDELTPSPNRTLTDQQVEGHLVGAPMSLGYRPQTPINGIFDRGSIGGTAIIAEVDAMLDHPYVATCMRHYKAGISSVEFDVDASSVEIKKFVIGQCERFWERSLSQVQTAYDYGWHGSEVVYAREGDHVAFERLIDFAPLDVTVYTHEHAFDSIHVRNVPGGTDKRLWGPRYAPSKGFWYAHQRRFNQWYGRSQLASAWRPWRRLAMPDGAEYVLDVGMYKFGINPVVVRYPDEALKQPGGSTATPEYKTGRDAMRQLAEELKAGGIAGLPSTTYGDGKSPKWSIEWPSKGVDTTPLIENCKNLERQIACGIGIPPELLEAAETGSGYSGRAIPMESFLSEQHHNARAILWAFAQQVLVPLVKWNFGPESHFHVRIPPLLETKMKMKVSMQQAAAAAQGGGLQVPPDAPPDPGIQLATNHEWVPYEGPHGGRGWQDSTNPADIRYQDNKPGSFGEHSAGGKTAAAGSGKAMTYDQLRQAIKDKMRAIIDKNHPEGEPVAPPPGLKGFAMVTWYKDHGFRQPLTSERRRLYQSAIHDVVEKMPRGCLTRFVENVEGVYFHPNVDSLTAAYHLSTKNGWDGAMMGRKVGGIWVHADGQKGELHIDGGKETDKYPDAIQEIYAHEFSHAVDGNYEFSKSVDWRDAWKEEVKKPGFPLTRYAATTPHEGFAEFGRLVFTDASLAKEHFPKCWAFWEGKGLT